MNLVAVIDEAGYKRVMDVSVPPRETATRKSIGLWDTRGDPKEQVDLSGKMPVRAAYGEQLIAWWLLDQKDWRRRCAAAPAPRVDISDRLRK